MNLIPDTEPELFTLSAVIIGYLLIGDSSANEQNALGNWLMLVAQILCTNAYFIQVKQEREKNNKQFDYNINTIDMLERMLSAINKELTNLKKKTF